MTHPVAVQSGWLPYTANPALASCHALFDKLVTQQLRPKIQDTVSQLALHPHFASDYATAVLRIPPRQDWLSFDLALKPYLVHDLLAAPEVQAALNAGLTPNQALDAVRAKPAELDAWTRGLLHLSHELVAASRTVYGAAMQTLLSLRQAPEYGEHQVVALLSGSPPSSEGETPSFDVHFEVGVSRGWYTCPDCSDQVADIPVHHVEGGRPLCPTCSTFVQAPA